MGLKAEFYDLGGGILKLTETYEWNHVHSTGIDAIETTPEYFAKLAEDETNVQKATDFLEKLGIRVKTEYGNYRPIYDVLRDIGDAMSRC